MKNNIPSPLEFYSHNLEWFNPEAYNMDAFDPTQDPNKKIHFFGNRRAGNTYTLLFTVLHDLLITQNKKRVYLHSFNANAAFDMFRTIFEIYTDLEESMPNFHMFNQIRARTKDSITFQDGSSIHRFKRNMQHAFRGIDGYDFWFVGDEFNMYRDEDYENLYACRMMVKPFFNLRELYAN